MTKLPTLPANCDQQLVIKDGGYYNAQKETLLKNGYVIITDKKTYSIFEKSPEKVTVT